MRCVQAGRQAGDVPAGVPTRRGGSWLCSPTRLVTRRDDTHTLPLSLIPPIPLSPPRLPALPHPRSCPQLFPEEVVRGGPAFAVSLVLTSIEPRMRAAAELGAWQVRRLGRWWLAGALAPSLRLG